MNDTADEIRQALTTHRQTKHSNFPEALRQRAARWAQEARKEGLTQAAIARQLDTKWPTLSRWAKGPSRNSRLRPTRVRLSATKSPPLTGTRPAPTLIAPTGHRVEGLSLTQVAELLGMLS